LLLTSFILVFAFSYSFAQTVVFDNNATVLRGNEDALDITVDNPAAISAFEIIFEVSETSATGAVFDDLTINWDPDAVFGVLLNRYVDYSGFTNGTLPGTIRMYGMLQDDSDACLDPGQTVVAEVVFYTNNVCSGSIVLDGTTVTIDKCNSCIITAETQFVDCATGATVPAAVTAGTVTIINAPPQMASIPDHVMDWADFFSYQTVVTDDDLNSSPMMYESHTYSVSSVPPCGIGVSPTGLVTWSPTPADMVNACEYQVTVTVEDGCNVVASRQFMIYLWNDAPEVVCPTEVNQIVWGYAATGTVTGSDLDGGPLALTYSVVDWAGPGTVTIDPANGDWEWQTLEDPAYLGDFTLCIKVTDGAAIGCNPTYTNESNADTCCLPIHVISTGDVMILTDYPTRATGALLGSSQDVTVEMTNSTLDIGGYDFLIEYDQTVIALTGVAQGQFLTGCDWEYFEYRQGAAGNCGSNACDPGIVRIVAIADINNGLAHPSCFTGPPLGTGELAVLTFLISTNHTYECMFVPINFIWYDCGDNGISSVTGDTLFISRWVYNAEGVDITDPTADFPTIYGAPDDCDVSGGQGKPEPLRIIDFWDGGIEILCNEEIDDRGDINMNGIAYEIADAVLFTNYFLYGLGVFDVGINAPAGQVAATDVNADGITLSVADLVYLIRVIVGDALPYPKTVSPVKVAYTHGDNGVVTVNGTQIGAAFITASGNVVPELKATAMDMKYRYDEAANATRILVYSIEGNSFSGECVTIASEIVSIEMATREGNPINASLTPTHFALNQNYPNPFNPTTTISFTLPVASDYNVTVYNVSGQVVDQLSGTEAAGEVTVEWNAGSLASGIYFYKLQAGNFTDTKKMVLLK
jgi:hypothetical protein